MEQVKEAVAGVQAAASPVGDVPDTPIPNQEEILEDGAKIASKALSDLETNKAYDKFIAEMQRDPSTTASAYAMGYVDKVRRAGLNDIAILIVAGSLIITGIVNILREAGQTDQGCVTIQNKAMKTFVQGALQQDRMQNGYTEGNTPPDAQGRTINDELAPGSAPSALGGEQNG